MGFVDLVDAAVGVTEARRVLIEPVELGVGQQGRGPCGDLRFELTAQPVDAAQVVQVERGDDGAGRPGRVTTRPSL